MIHKLIGVLLILLGVFLVVGGNSYGMIITTTGEIIILGCLLGGLGLVII